jgi:hypothetical protein
MASRACAKAKPPSSLSSFQWRNMQKGAAKTCWGCDPRAVICSKIFFIEKLPSPDQILESYEELQSRCNGSGSNWTKLIALIELINHMDTLIDPQAMSAVLSAPEEMEPRLSHQLDPSNCHLEYMLKAS